MIESLQDQVSKLDGQLERLKKLAIDLGAKNQGLHFENVVRILESSVKAQLEAETRAREAGYKSLLIALKAVGQKSTFANIPTDLTVAPSQWIVPLSITEVSSGNKTFTRTNPAVNATQAQGKLKKLLPLIEEFCQDNIEEGIESLKEAFYTLSYESFSEELLGLIAEKRGRAEGIEKNTDSLQDSCFEPLGLPVGELILSYQRLTQRWMKDDTDFQRMVKDAIYPMRLDLVEEAAALDTLNDNQNAEIASLLIPTAFFGLADIGLTEVTGYELNHPDELPTRGKDFLQRLKKIGVGPSIKDYQSAMSDL